MTINEMKQQHPRIHRISADRFYALATGKEDAFLELVEALPVAIRDFLETNKMDLVKETGNDNSAYQEICQAAQKDGHDVISHHYHACHTARVLSRGLRPAARLRP